MTDALGDVESVLVLGGNSDIAKATLRKLVANRARRVVLASRNVDQVKDHIQELEALGATDVSAVAFDALDFASHEKFVDEQFAGQRFDLVLLAFGALGDQEHDEKHPQDAIKVVETNFTGAVSVLLPVATKMKAQGRGTIVVLSTVAGERARAANFIYGSSKAGLDAFCQGLGDSLVGSGVTLSIIRPGFVTTKMTAGMETKPMSTDAESVADVVVNAIAKRTEIAWAPGKLRFVFSVMRHLPRPIFRKIKA
jgi:decaprenylphospho-beta-D-erythro-pentofuranosid-2-ulose 2-reductase